MIFNPHDYQRRAGDYLYTHKRAALFADPGLGKTAIMLQLIDRLAPLRALVIAPLNVIYKSWPDEIQKWNSFNHLTFEILHGRKKKDYDLHTKDISLLNVENTTWLLTQYEMPWDILIVDESTRYKTTKSIRFRKLRDRLDEFEYRYIMTGTPIPDSYQDLYSQMFIVDKGRSLGRKKSHYLKKHFYAKQNKRKTNGRIYQYITYELRSGHESDITNQIKESSFTVDNQSLKLPEIIYHEIPVQFTPKLAAQYNEVEKQLFLSLDTDNAKTTNKYMQCRQFANGCLYDEKREVVFAHELKIEAIKNLIDELHGKPVIIFYYFNHDLQLLKYAFGAPHIGSKVKPKERNEIIDDWNNDKIKILLAQPTSVSLGLNMQMGSCRDIVWYSLTDKAEDHYQANRRIARQGKTGTVRVHYLLMENTVDYPIIGRLRDKTKQQKTMLETLMDYRREKAC